MILSSYLETHVLINNTYDVLDYNVFRTRLITRYGKREMRIDLEIEDYEKIAQNVIDVNLPFFRSLLENTLNPFSSWIEKGESLNTNDTVTDSNTTTNGEVTHSGNVEHTASGTITNAGSNETTDSGTSNENNPTSSITKNKVNAYNSVESVPSNESAITGTSTRENSYSGTQTSNLSNTETLDTSHKDIYNNSDTNTSNVQLKDTQNTTENNNYTKSGFKIGDYEAALRIYYSAYDIIVDFVIREILMPIADLR